MCRVLVLVALAFLLCPLAAQAKPNTLTPEEAVAGWLALFDGETTYGWAHPGDPPWTVAEGTLRAPAEKPGLLVSTTAFADYELKFEYQLSKDGKGALQVHCDAAGKRIGAGDVVDLPNHGPVWSEILASVRGRAVWCWELKVPGKIDVGTVGVNRDKTPATGHFAFSGHGLLLRNVKLRPLHLGSLFNGKDLTGWKEFPGRKSKFAVTKEGWLNVKDGPGDLQTEGQWADFVVQLECISNGKHLNSGIFFRCRPGEYQQGYEAQIRNEFTEATRDYTIDIYDPKTHEPKSKEKIQSPAVDYGTGAIYRRMPARQQASRDGEWFTLTIVAHGRHLATWVNGVHVADWTDHRALNDNARQGCRLEKGPLSIQGHDPTTDLSFRNFRLAELPPAKQ